MSNEKEIDLDGVKIRKKSLADYHPDDANLREHTPRGVGMIVKSVNDVGAGRSGVCDENGKILAGNATFDALAEAGIQNVVEVETDGTSWVVVKRPNLDEERKIRLAITDNRAGELSSWKADKLKDVPKKIWEDLFYEDERQKMFSKLDPDAGKLKDVDPDYMMNKYSVTIKCENEIELNEVLSLLNLSRRLVKFAEFMSCFEKKTSVETE